MKFKNMLFVILFAFSVFFSVSVAWGLGVNTGYTCTTTPSKVLTARAATKTWVVISDQTNTQTAYIGFNSSVTSARGAANSGMPLNSGNTINDSQFQTQVVELWCVTASGTATIVVSEVRR